MLFCASGCQFHGCLKCCRDRDQRIPGTGRTTVEEAFRSTQQRLRKLHALGYNLHIKWECDLKRELKESADMRKYFRDLQVYDPLLPRDVCRNVA